MSAQLALCVEAVTKVATFWEASSDENRHGLASRLFEEIVYDLDAKRIVDFQMKAWAEQFLILQGKLYEEVGNRGYGCTPKCP